MRAARKSSLYRNEVTEGAVGAVRAALARVAAGTGPLLDARRRAEHGWQPPLRQATARDRLEPRRHRDRAAQDPLRPTASRASKTSCSIGASGCSMPIRRLTSRGDRRHAHRAPPRRHLPRHARWRRVDRRSCSRRSGRSAVSSVPRCSRSALWRMPCRAAMTTPTDGERGSPGARDPLRGARRRRLSAFRFLQRRAVHRAMRAPARRLCARAPAADPSHRADGRSGFLVQRHAPALHRGRRQPRRRLVGQHQRASTISPATF